MTKPHTTLSEAIRALELPEHAARVESQADNGVLATVWLNRAYGLPYDSKVYTTKQFEDFRESAAALAEQSRYRNSHWLPINAEIA